MILTLPHSSFPSSSSGHSNTFTPKLLLQCSVLSLFHQSIVSLTTTRTLTLNLVHSANYYTEYFDDYFKTLNTGGRPRGDILAAAFEAGYKIPPHALGKIDRSPNPGAAASFAAAAAPAAGPPRQ